MSVYTGTSTLEVLITQTSENTKLDTGTMSVEVIESQAPNFTAATITLEVLTKITKLPDTFLGCLQENISTIY